MARTLALLAFAFCIGSSWAKDDFWPPLDEEWRCLEQSHSRAYVEETHDLLINAMNPEAHVLKEQDIDCPIIDPLDPSWCAEEGEYFPIKCNCHAYYRCFQLIPDKPRIPCIYKCWPYELVFDPNSKSCVMENQAPPGTCYATNVTHSTTPTPPPTTPTPVPTTPTPTTPKPTTPKPTTTTPKPTTSTTTTTTTPPTTTPYNPYGCEYDGQKLPYPGDCHKYFRCVQDANNPNAYEVEVFDCGEWVFDPNQGSCVWPEIDNDLCP